MLKPPQRMALANPCRLAAEAKDSRFTWRRRTFKTLRMTVNTGWQCIEAGFGGSVWQASVEYRRVPAEGVAREALIRALAGVGIEQLQWWEESRGGVWSLRRRLTPGEEAAAGAPVDIRGTPEHVERASIVAARHGVPLDTVLRWG